MTSCLRYPLRWSSRGRRMVCFRRRVLIGVVVGTTAWTYAGLRLVGRDCASVEEAKAVVEGRG